MRDPLDIPVSFEPIRIRFDELHAGPFPVSRGFSAVRSRDVRGGHPVVAGSAFQVVNAARGLLDHDVCRIDGFLRGSVLLGA
ncbi:hypothetical protein [Nocardia jejuensis]|uniref:hypothetical protein n=1 Tax=Nocardia jejuensis TaxID=328049 RepID=UPI00082EF340|nr:hypothetical protein [Nocardia jejuensis]